MDYLKINMTGNANPWWIDIFNWLKDNVIVFTSFALGWKGIDQGFKYLANGRAAEIRQIVQEEIKSAVNPSIRELTEGIKELRESIWDLKNEIKK